MSFFDALHTSASGLNAQRMRMNLISSNLANANTTRTAQGGPYKRKDAVFAANPQGAPTFGDALAGQMTAQRVEVQVTAIREDPRPPIEKYDPGHPDADEEGMVLLPNINVVEEMVNMISASRSYEANVTALQASKEMAASALEIGR
ncbi:flagellar basal body rod protein FlgC [Desulfatitalea alkaliphila]|uniref:Flagellar basal-body rod protein FlgC n=1 Tax=Desulfatitalea alkaliphila TaxID=2929485 RepID=A0AA41UQF1_9BACT|nr:flagellar basal body rod protein FlgC [Desulfatitalea alkaliphila]MCJ8501313.1 flagellar basal body rod protein FlgC [Desulfatitalea alkaliphila]